MRGIPINILPDTPGRNRWLTSFRMNRQHYVQEALGLYIFMVSACFFGALLFSTNSPWVHFFPSASLRNLLMGIAMGLTALFIFYSRWTAPSGSHINPAVTLSFWRLGKISRHDAVFYMLAQFIGGLLAVYSMQYALGPVLTDPPVNSVVTVPGKYGTTGALVTEFSIAFITMSMVLFTSANEKQKRYTRILSAVFVCCWVLLAGPVSGFGMNPARSFASALPAHTWASFWIYLLAPTAGMLSASELFLLAKKKKWRRHLKVVHRQYETTNQNRLKQHETTLTVSNG